MKYSIVLVSFLFLLLGCNSEKHLSKKTNLYHDKYEEQVAKKCSQWYPAVQSTDKTTSTVRGKSDTVLLPGEVKWKEVDCTEAIKNGIKTVRVPYPVHDTIKIHTVDTVKTTDKVVIVDKAKETTLQLRAEKAERELSASNTRSDMYFWWAIIATSIIVIRILLKLIFKI